MFLHLSLVLFVFMAALQMCCHLQLLAVLIMPHCIEFWCNNLMDFYGLFSGSPAVVCWRSYYEEPVQHSTGGPAVRAKGSAEACSALRKGGTPCLALLTLTSASRRASVASNNTMMSLKEYYDIIQTAQ